MSTHIAHNGRPYRSGTANATTRGTLHGSCLADRSAKPAPAPGRAGRPDSCARVRSGIVQTSDGGRPERAARIRRRDRHGRGLRGVLAPPGVPLHRTRAQQFDDLVLQAVARLEPRWEAHLAGVEIAVEEIPPPAAVAPGTAVPGPVPLARLDPGSSRITPQETGWPGGHAHPAGEDAPGMGLPDVTGPDVTGPGEGWPGVGGRSEPAQAGPVGPDGRPAGSAAPRPPRIVVYRRPLLARADTEEDLAELVFEVVVEEFARLLGVDPADVDPGYPEDD